MKAAVRLHRCFLPGSVKIMLRGDVVTEQMLIEFFRKRPAKQKFYDMATPTAMEFYAPGDLTVTPVSSSVPVDQVTFRFDEHGQRRTSIAINVGLSIVDSIFAEIEGYFVERFQAWGSIDVTEEDKSPEGSPRTLISIWATLIALGTRGYDDKNNHTKLSITLWPARLCAKDCIRFEAPCLALYLLFLRNASNLRTPRDISEAPPTLEHAWTALVAFCVDEASCVLGVTHPLTLSMSLMNSNDAALISRLELFLLKCLWQDSYSNEPTSHALGDSDPKGGSEGNQGFTQSSRLRMMPHADIVGALDGEHSLSREASATANDALNNYRIRLWKERVVSLEVGQNISNELRNHNSASVPYCRWFRGNFENIDYNQRTFSTHPRFLMRCRLENYNFACGGW